MAYFYNTRSNTLISGTSEDDDIKSVQKGGNVTIIGGAGNDSVDNLGSVIINTGAGNDYVLNTINSNSVTIDTGSGNDSIDNNSSKVTINTGAGNDSVNNDNLGNSVIINTGDGNDEVENSGDKVTINSGAGNDYVLNYWGSSVTINTGAGNDSVYNSGSEVTINTGEGSDSLNNYGVSVTITGEKGNDYIYNNCYRQNDGSIYYYYDYYHYGNNVLFKYSSGDGNDIIYGFNETSTLSIGGGSYSTKKSGEDIIVTVGDGKISLIGAANLNKINITGTEGGDTVENSWELSGTTATYGDKIKITGVKSLDGISLSGKVVTIANSSLNKSKVTISDGYTLKLASDVTKTSNKKAWSLSGTTAKYNQTTKAGYKLANNVITYTKKATKTLVTVSGVKSTSGLSISGKIVTIAASSLNKSKITISDGYNLKLASDVAKTSNKKAWSLSGTTAKYNQTTKAGYKLANNVITYTKKATKTLATINGAKSKSGISISGKTIKLAASALSKKVSVSGSYAFEFASDYKSAKITGSSSADTIKTAGANMTITGGKGNDSLTGGKGADIFVYSNGYGNDIITNFDENDRISIKSGTAEISTSGNDVIFNVGTGKITLKNANGKNITYFDADGNENVYPEKNSGVEYNSDGTGATLTAKYSKSSFEPSGTYKDILVTIDASAVTNELTITGNKKANRIIGSEENDTIKGGNGKDTIIAGDGNDKIYGDIGNDSLIGGDGEDSLWGGVDSDTLWGGDGDDTFIYKNGDGKVTIADFEVGDMIMILSDKVDDYDVGKNDVTINIHGGGQIVVKNGSNKYIQPISGDGIELKRHNPK